MIKATDEQIMKGLVSLNLQEKIAKFSDDALNKVNEKLFEDYNCYLPDCYDNPVYLGKVLKDLFGNSNIIVESIKDSLSSFATRRPISEFLDGLNTKSEQRQILGRGLY